METIDTQYIFTREDGVDEFFDIKLDSKTLVLLNELPNDLPDWTELSFHQCPNCPLDSTNQHICPAAAHLSSIITSFEGLNSYDSVHVKIITKERNISQNTTIQRAIGSLMGLILATCGCPLTSFLRPMARFHLPLASEDETIFRAVSMYLLAQYFAKQEGKCPDLELAGLKVHYQNIHRVNTALGERIRAATETDFSVNAIIFLDMYAQVVPFVINEAVDELRYLFTPYLAPDDPKTIG